MNRKPSRRSAFVTFSLRFVSFVIVTLVVSIVCRTTLRAQQSSMPAPEFAVASVKTSQADTSTSRPGAFLPGGSFVAQNASLRILIHRAYPEYTDRPGRINGPAWIDTARFDVDARAGREATREEMIPMLRALLADRFGLRVHTETRQENGFALVLARADGRLGPGLRRTQTTCTILETVPPATARADLPACALYRGITNGLTTVSFRGTTLGRLVLLLQSAAGGGVVDRTGLAGGFDIDLEWASDDALLASREPDARPGIVTAVQELGLKLEPSRAPLEVLIIDTVRQPMAN